MNYKSQLKGWAVDRVIEWHKANGGVPNMSLQELEKAAESLSSYAYVPREDLESTAKDLFELARNAAPGEASIAALIGTLEHIKNDRVNNRVDNEDGSPFTEPQTGH